MSDQTKDYLKEHPTVKALAEHQVRLHESDVAFGRKYLRIAGSTWGLIKRGDYAGMVQDLQPTLEKLAAALALLNDQALRADLAGDSGVILPFGHIKAALQALKECYGEPQNRLTVFLAPTGGGKSTLARKIREDYLGNAVLVEATEAWRKSYFAAAVAVARACGSSTQFTVTAGVTKVEDELVDKFGAEGRVLCIDEGHYCGPAALNLIKFLLNRTGVRVLLMAIPELWQRMEKGAYKEVEQLKRRTAAKVTLAKVSTDEAREFLSAKLPGFESMNGERAAVTRLLCDAANRFGLWDTLARVCKEFAKEAGDRPASMDLVRSALNRVEALRS
jgi:type II secretory pathway predicted ATPase ExeA